MARRYMPTSAGSGLLLGLVAPSMSVHVALSSDLDHCHRSAVTLSSSSDRLAPSGRSTWGCRLSMFTVPDSSTSVTVTATSWAPPEASTVTL